MPHWRHCGVKPPQSGRISAVKRRRRLYRRLCGQDFTAAVLQLRIDLTPGVKSILL
jgi:hypothetical protein